MKKQALQAQYERACPLLVARYLLKRSRQDGALMYHTLGLKDVGQDLQMQALIEFQKKGLIETPDLHFKDGEVQIRIESIPEEGGRVLSVRVLPALLEYYSASANYNALTVSGEMSIEKMAEWLMSLLEQKASRFNKKDIAVYDEEIVTDEVNPFLAATYLEMSGNVDVEFFAPPKKVIDVKEIILELGILNSANTIQTSRFSYDLKTGILKLANGKTTTLTLDSQHDRILKAMHSRGLLTKEEIIKIAERHSDTMTDDRAATNLMGEIREKIGVVANSAEDIFRTVRGKGYALVD